MRGFSTVRSLILTGILCLMLEGCVIVEYLEKLESNGAKASKTAEPTPPEMVASKPPAVEEFGREWNKKLAPHPRAKPVGFTVNPHALVNLDEGDIRDVMGAPAMVREEPPAVVWSYLSGECRLDVYLYENLSTKVLRSLTYVVETSRKDVNPEEYCLQRVN